jgi:positive regulator of sigma E activity
MSEHALQVIEHTDQGVLVAGPGTGACASCSLNGLCGHRLFGRSHPLLLRYEGAQDQGSDFSKPPPEWVRLHIDDDAVLKAAATAYGAPLLSMLAMSVLAAVVWVPAAPLFALAGLLLGHGWARRQLRGADLDASFITHWQVVQADSASKPSGAAYSA